MSTGSGILSDSDFSTEGSNAGIFSDRVELKEREGMSDIFREELCEYMIYLYNRRAKIFHGLHERKMVC